MAPSHTPVFKEPPEPKRHQLQHSLKDEDNGEHIVAVLEGLVQRLGAERQAVEAVLLHPTPHHGPRHPSSWVLVNLPHLSSTNLGAWE